MSDDENEAPNLSSDQTPHDEFDFQVLFSNFSMEAPKMEKILLGAKKFGDSHRFLINKFILEPTMSTKKMNLLFAKHMTTVTLRRHPEAVMRIQTNPEESRELSKTIVKTMNNDKGKGAKVFRPWRFVISTDEKTPKEYVTMTGCSRNSSIISEASDLTKPERALFLAILEEMMNADGTVKMTWIHSLIREESYKMPGVKCDILMTKMIRQKYFSLDEDKEIVEITPRILVELEPWLRAKFAKELKICELCRKIICRPVYTAECKKCHVFTHYNCFVNATVISKQDNVECQKCQDRISLDEVKKQIDSKKTSGVARAPSRSQSRANSAPKTVTKSSSRSQNRDSDADDIKDEPKDVEEDTEEDEAEVTLSNKSKSGGKRRAVVDSDSD